jgi:cytochrome c-type biogenesis protein CcmE
LGMSKSPASPPEAGRPSRGAAWKIVVSVVVVTGAVAFMLTRSMSPELAYYKHVDEVMSAADSLRAQRLQVHGHVVDGSVEQAKGTLQYRFKLESRPPRPHAVMTATYAGLVPDTFKSGAEVVATGNIAPDNTLQVVPEGIMAKCPSKYEAGKAGPTPGAAAAATATITEAPKPAPAAAGP